MDVRTGSINKSELDKLFHLDLDNRGTRVIPQLPVYAPDYRGDQYCEDWNWPHWYIWVEQGGELIRMQAESIKGRYFGTEPAAEDDVRFPPLEFYTQHLSWPNLIDAIGRIETDFRNLAACMAKLATYQQMTDCIDFNSRPFVVTELEYIFAVCRSLYDLLQKLAWRLWNIVELPDGGWNELPRNSFASMALSGDEPVPGKELVETYGLPEPVGEFYESEAEFFSVIRDFRDDIIHDGESINLIFDTGDAFVVPADLPPFCEFDVWDEDTFLENDLAPLWPPVAHVIHRTLEATDRFTRAFAEDLAVLPPIAPDYQVYLRGENVPNLVYLDRLIDEVVWGEEFVESCNIDLAGDE